jgi:hypothetical protein
MSNGSRCASWPGSLIEMSFHHYSDDDDRRGCRRSNPSGVRTPPGTCALGCPYSQFRAELDTNLSRIKDHGRAWTRASSNHVIDAYWQVRARGRPTASSSVACRSPWLTRRSAHVSACRLTSPATYACRAGAGRRDVSTVGTRS